MWKLKLAVALGVALVAAGVAYAAAKPLITAQPLAAARLAKPLTIRTAKPGDLIFVQAKVMPGGDFGWHLHRSPVAVAVVAGTLTLYDSADPSCSPQRITAGTGFVEQANHVHLARNEGTKPVKLFVAYLGAPRDQRPDVPASAPAQCGSVK
jgi:hypothetical protein